MMLIPTQLLTFHIVEAYAHIHNKEQADKLSKIGKNNSIEVQFIHTKMVTLLHTIYIKAHGTQWETLQTKDL